MRLVVRPEGISRKESLKGIMLRASAANGFRSFRWIQELAMLPVDFAARPCDLSMLADLLGHEARKLAAAANWPMQGKRSLLSFGSTTLSASALNLTHPKICVQCLRGGQGPGVDEAVCDRLWDLCVILACPRHRCLLVDRCPRCNRRLSWNRPAPDRCRCGASLLPVAPTSAPEELVAIAEQICSLQMPARSEPTPSRTDRPPVDLNMATRLIWFFGTTLPLSQGSTGAQWRSAAISKPDLEGALPIVKAGAQVLLHWPDGLFDWLAGHRRPNESSVGVLAQFGPLFRHLRWALKDLECAFVFDAVRLWLRSEWEEGIVKPSSFFSSQPGAAPRYLSAAHVARELKVTQATVEKLLSSGALQGKKLRSGRRLSRIVETESLTLLKKRRAECLSIVEAARYLGVSSFQVKAFCNCGVLERQMLTKRSFGFCARQVNDLIVRLTERCPCANRSSSEDTVLLSEVPRFRLIRLSVLIQHILNNDDHPVHRDEEALGTAPALSQFWIRQADLFRNWTSVSCQIHYTVRDASRALKLSTRMMPVLVRAGCLSITPESHSASPLPKRSISPEALRAFSKAYMTSRAVAQLHGTSPKMITERLSASGVTPIIQSDPGHGISAIWKARDIALANLGNLRTETEEEATRA